MVPRGQPCVDTPDGLPVGSVLVDSPPPPQQMAVSDLEITGRLDCSVLKPSFLVWILVQNWVGVGKAEDGGGWGVVGTATRSA